MYPSKAILIGCNSQPDVELRRELESLSIEIDCEVADIEACLAYLADHAIDRRLFVVNATSAAELGRLPKLKQAAVGQPILALVAYEGDSPFEQPNAGHQMVRLPLRPSELRSAVHRIAVQVGHATLQSRTVVVLGATEGSGCTTISVNLASELGRLENAPCLLGEEAFGRLANYLGVRPKVTLYDLASDLEHLTVERMREALTRVEENLVVLVGSYRSIKPLPITPEAAFKTLACAMQLAETVVVDARYNFDEVDFEFVSKVQHVVLVAKPTVPSLHSLRILLELLAQRPFVGKRYVVINQFDESEKTISKRSIEAHLKVPEVFLVAADPTAVGIAESTCQTLRQSGRRSQTLNDITALARMILELPAEKEPRGSFRESLERMSHFWSLMSTRD